MAEPEKTKSVSELTTELIDLTNGYVRQEIRATVDGSVVRPLKRAGRWLALVTVASTLFALASIFLAVGAFQLLATIVGATWIAYLIIGGILLLAGAGLAAALMRKDQDNGR